MKKEEEVDGESRGFKWRRRMIEKVDGEGGGGGWRRGMEMDGG